MTTFHELLNAPIDRRTLLAGLSTAALVGCSKSPELPSTMPESIANPTIESFEPTDPTSTSTEPTLEQNNERAKEAARKIGDSTANLAYAILTESQLGYKTNVDSDVVALYNKTSDQTGSDKIPRVQVYYFKNKQRFEISVADGRPAKSVSAVEPVDMITISYDMPDDNIFESLKGMTPDDMLGYVSALPIQDLQTIKAFSSEGEITLNLDHSDDISGTAMSIQQTKGAYEICLANGGDGELQVQQDGGAYSPDPTIMGEYDLALAEAVKVTERAFSKLHI